MKHAFQTVGIVGTGAMGRGIAQICAQADSLVWLYDSQPQACQQAIDNIQAQWTKLVEKGRLTPEQAHSYGQRLKPAGALADLAGCDLVIEAIVEKLEVKQAVFKQLEELVRADAVLATNTSSLSVTSIAAALKHPERFAGYHYFNPVPVMKVVEVIAGLRTQQIGRAHV